ncbi:DUF5343 domain-containing protein [Pseudoxanthomonas sp. GW2]|uniref:DUF5343 domain-containing protein n=1 Tax=Pseudoxanthomonas sp. GW2 TaxID=1211114 RepID=UPI000367586B|nr:DUF5343 domain-containing protein [Pseudoxanthomonas sp. GW2]
MPTEPDKALKPPYGSFTTLANQIDKLAEHGLPNQVDASLFRHLSGGVVSPLLAGLKYLALVDELGKPTQLFHELVEASEKEKAAIWKKIVHQSYPFMFDGSVPLETATTSQVEQAFRDQQITGSTITKAVAFFLSAAEVAGIKVSKFVKVPKPRNGATKGARKKVKGEAAIPPSDPPPPATPAQTQHHPFIEGLLRELPPPGPTVEFPLAKRTNWLEIAARTFEMIYARAKDDDQSLRIAVSVTDPDKGCASGKEGA